MRRLNQIVVSAGGERYRVTYAEDGRVSAVDQQIVPLRAVIHWRRLHPTSRAWARAVLAADAKKVADDRRQQT